MKIVRQGAQLVDVAITFGPDCDGARHVAEASEPAEEHRHAVHVFGTVAALNKPPLDDRHVGRGALQFEPSLLVAHGHRDVREVLPIIAVCATRGIPVQTEDCSFFRLGPKTFPADVGADPSDDLRTKHAQEKDTDHDGDKNANDDTQLTADGKAAKHFFLNSHAESSAWKLEWRIFQLPRPQCRKVVHSGAVTAGLGRQSMISDLESTASQAFSNSAYSISCSGDEASRQSDLRMQTLELVGGYWRKACEVNAIRESGNNP